MAEWRTGRKLGVTLYRDEVFVGHVCSAMVAAEIVETMNRVDRLLDEVRQETGRERSQEAGECTAETWSWSHFRDTQLDGYWIRCTLSVPHEEHEDEHTGLRWRDGDGRDGEQPRDAQRRSEATPQKDLPCPGCGRTSHGMACSAQLAAAVREDAFMRRLDPYDHSKGFTPKNGEHPE